MHPMGQEAETNCQIKFALPMKICGRLIATNSCLMFIDAGNCLFDWVFLGENNLGKRQTSGII